MVAIQNPSLSVFLAASTAPDDAIFLHQLELCLKPLKQQGVISFWSLHNHLPSVDHQQTRAQKIEEADIVLLLVSPDFLADDFCMGQHLQWALRSHEAGQARVIPILVRPSDWGSTSFAHLQPLPVDKQPIMLWSNQDEAWAEVTVGIRLAIEDLSLSPKSAIHQALPKIWSIPFSRNWCFTGREELLTRISTHLRTGHGKATALVQSPQAINGLGGIGKTQIAVEYAYRHASKYQNVFWVRAERRESLYASYSEIATKLNLSQRQVQVQDLLVEAVKHWFQTHRHWLLILDNADEPDLLLPFLPSTSGGHILITTRASDIQQIAIRLEVETLNEEQGATLLLRRASLLAANGPLTEVPEELRKQALLLSRELGGLPLALDQAGAYLAATGIGVQKYRQLYQDWYLELVKEYPSLVVDYPDSVVTTWSLSFTRVEEKNPAAADLLRICAYLAPDAIPETILTRSANVLGDVLSPVVADPVLFGQAIEVLRAYSLIKRDPQIETLTVHQLVQAIVREQIGNEDATLLWQQRAMQAVVTARPDVADVAQWDACEQWVPHALLCATWIIQEQVNELDAALLLNQAGYYLRERGRYSDAQPLYERALAIREQMLGEQHPSTATSLNNLAELYGAQGKYVEAEPLYERALAIYEQVLGEEDPSTLMSLNNLAGFYNVQGKYWEAEPLYKRALVISEQVLGEQHPDTAMSLNNLAMLYDAQKKYGEAEPLYKRALAIREQVLGEQHADTAASLNNLGELYREQGKYEEAESLYKRALVIYEQVLGEQHPDTASCFNNLAALYREQGKYGEAESLYKRALEICEQVLGEQHPDTASSLNNLAALYDAQKKYGKAEPFYARALAIDEQILGPAHPDTAMDLNNLAALYDAQGKYEEAEPLYERALAIREQVFGEQHLDTAMSLNNLAELYDGQGKYEEAEPLYQRALAIYEQVLGKKHPDTQVVRTNYDELLRAMEAKKRSVWGRLRSKR